MGGYDAAIGGNNASTLIDSNIFRNNNCDTQFLSGVISFINSSSPLIVNNMFIDNACCGINFTLPSGNLAELTNNTLIGNSTGVYFGSQAAAPMEVFRNYIIFGAVSATRLRSGTRSIPNR